MSRHDPDSIRVAIEDEWDRMSLEVGRLLAERRAQAPRSFERWVVDKLDMDPMLANRLVAVWEAHQVAPGAVAPRLAWAG